MLRDVIDEFLLRDQVHHIRSQMHRLKIDISARNARNDNDLLQIQELSDHLMKAEDKLKWQRFFVYLNTPCWRYRVRS